MQRIFFILCLLVAFSSTTQAQSTVVVQPGTRTTQDIVETSVGDAGFFHAVRKANRKAFFKKSITAKEFRTIRVGTFAPAAREEMILLAKMQIRISGQDRVELSDGSTYILPRTQAGAIDWENIDWDKLFEFIEKLLTLIFQLIG